MCLTCGAVGACRAKGEAIVPFLNQIVAAVLEYMEDDKLPILQAACQAVHLVLAAVRCCVCVRWPDITTLTTHHG